MTLKVKKLTSFWEKSIGLIGADPLYPIYFTTRWGIHTFGVRAPIDVFILDDEMKIQYARTIRPYRFFFWNPRYKHVIELPSYFPHTLLSKRR